MSASVSMNPALHQQMRQVFDAASALPQGERPAFVAQHCADSKVAEQVLRWLAATEEGPFLAAPEQALTKVAGLYPPAEVAGLVVERYVLLRPLGEGGFGVVWLAQQRQPVQRQVALKLLKPGMDSAQVVARFEQERQALALLDHPHIAKVLDAGTGPSGRPYFAMEFVDGLPLMEFSDQQSLAIGQRLSLLVQVCEAVQHAHGRGIVHRDLKPSNILVTQSEEGPQAKVIDFGIAKAMDRKLTENSLHTAAQQLVGTLHYMSPEQAAGSPDLDTRTDIWSLGVLLYEVLTGSLPFAGGTGDAWHTELLRQIKDQDPLRPSLRLAGRSSQLAELAARRRTTVIRLASTLRGELDWIVMRALAKERERRYQTANELAADLRRFLAGEPVLAAPPQAGYLLRKFVRRHRIVVAASAMVVVSMLGGILAFASQAEVARKERDRAVAAEAGSRQMLDFLLGALNSADPFENGEPDMRVVDAMARAAQLLDSRTTAISASVEFELRLAIATVQSNLGAETLALPHAERALELAKQLFSGDHDQMALALNALGQVQQQRGKFTIAEPLRREAAAMARRLHPAGDRSVVPLLHQHATVLAELGRSEEAAAVVEEALAMAGRLFAGDHWYLASLRNSVGHMHWLAGDSALAEPHFVAAVAMARRLEAGDHPKTSRYLANLAMARSEATPAEAEPLLVESLAILTRLHPGDHLEVARRQQQHATVLRALGRTADADRLVAQSLAICRRLQPGDHPLTASGLALQADLRRRAGSPEQAEPMLLAAWEMLRRLHPAGHPDQVDCAIALAEVLQQLGRADGVEPMLQEALAVAQRVPDRDSRLLGSVLRAMGYHAWAQRRGTEAITKFAEALALARDRWSGDRPEIMDLLDDLGSAQQLAGDFAAAEASFSEALAMHARLRPADPLLPCRLQLKLAEGRLAQGDAVGADRAFHAALALVSVAAPDTLADLQRALRAAGLSHQHAGRLAVAERLLTEVLSLCLRRFPPGHRETAVACDELGLVLARQGEPAKAEAVFSQGLQVLSNLPEQAPDLELRLLPKRAEMRRDLRQFAAAIEGYEAAVVLAARLHPGDHPVSVQLLRALGFTHWQAGVPKAAEASFAEALAMQRRLVRGDHRTTVNLLDDVGSAQLAQGHADRAKDSFAEALAMLRRLPMLDQAKERRLAAELARAEDARK